ncbi:MAG TPA: TonB family protein [Gemmatimonadales bacterium]|nr:TonB family protein [Gemmatimonadales bacterium]
MLRRLSVAASLFVVPALAAQNRTDARIAVARAHITAHEFSAADTALGSALDSAAYLMDSVHVFVWRAILEHQRGSDSLARQSFGSALALYPALRVNGLDQVAPGLDAVFESELRGYRVYAPGELDEQAAWRSGPPLAYPSDLRRRHVGGQAVVIAVVDTLGRVEQESFRVLDTPDSGFVEPLRRMMLAASFTPGRAKGQLVRSRVDLKFTLTPPPPRSPTALIGAARDQLRAHRADSALALTGEALDSINNATPGERVYAELVRGLAYRATKQDSLAEQSFTAGLAGYRDLTAQGVDLAPFLKRLADSIRTSRRGATSQPPVARTSPFGTVTVVGVADEPPALLSHPAIRYAPEMQALRIGGTVIVEATLDTTGHVLPATVKVVQTPNPVFDPEAKRVVVAAMYRPARVNRKAAKVTIRQPITFAAY